MTDNTTDRAIDSIVTQWRGGEHVLAGERASELIYGGSKKANEDLLKRITEQAQGIERYIAAPSNAPISQVDDQSGNPLATQPENRKDDQHASNLSNERAKSEQDEIDARLEAGRKQREKADLDPEVDPMGDTRLNPEGSDQDGKTTPKPKGTPNTNPLGKR